MTVAHRGRGWGLAPSLILLEAEFDRAFPRRSRASDGSIGDQAHAARRSDHNPEDDLRDDTDLDWVTAIDITHDPLNGCDVHAQARVIAARRDSRLVGGYIISNREIFTLERGWQRYTGSNGHTQHAHFSVGNTQSQRNNLSIWMPWLAPSIPFIPPPQPIVTNRKDDSMLIRSEGYGLFLMAPNGNYAAVSVKEFSDSARDGLPIANVTPENAKILLGRA